MSKLLTDYRPIDCDYYDQLEIHAMHGSWLNIEYEEDDHIASVIAKIQGLETMDKEEYIITDRGLRIRMDKVRLTTPLDPRQDMRGQLLQKMEYNQWANEKYILHLRNADQLPENVAKWMSHILNAQELWNKRILQMKPRYKVWQTHDPGQWSEINAAVHDDTFTILQNTDLSRVVSYHTTTGEPRQNTVADILFHITDHSSYHGGQIAYELRRSGMEPLRCDLIVYQRDKVG